MSALAMVARKPESFTVKIDFPDADIKVLIFSILYLLSIWTTVMLVKCEQCMTYTKFWAFWQKVVNHFWQSVDAILEDVPVTKTIVWC